MKGFTIVGYSYAADTYCPADIRRMFGATDSAADLDTEDILDHAVTSLGIADRNDEDGFDSGDFPKVIFASMVDGDEYCAACHEPLIGD